MNFMFCFLQKHPNELRKSLVRTQTKERALFVHLKRKNNLQKRLHLFAKLALI